MAIGTNHALPATNTVKLVYPTHAYVNCGHIRQVVAIGKVDLPVFSPRLAFEYTFRITCLDN